MAGVPVRNPGAVEFGRHYGLTVATCVPYDPASKGGSESTVKLAKADLVPTDANLLAGVRQLRGAGGGLRGVLRAGQRPAAPGHPPGPGGDARRGAAPAAPGPGGPVHRGAGRDPPGRTRCRWSTFEGGQYSVPHQLAGQVVHVRRHGEPGGDRPRRAGRAGRGRPSPGHHPGQPAARRGALPACPARGAEPRAEGPHRGRGGVPRDRRRRRAVAGRGRRGRRLPGPVQDGPGRPAGRPARDRAGRPGARPGRRRGPVRRRRPRRDPRPPGDRRTPASRPGPASSRTLAQGTGGWAARDGRQEAAR